MNSRYIILFSALLLTACPPAPDGLSPDNGDNTQNPNNTELSDGGQSGTNNGDAGGGNPAPTMDSGVNNPNNPPLGDGGVGEGIENTIGIHAFKRLGHMRSIFGLYGPLANIALNHSSFDTPIFVSTETTATNGHRSITYDFSASVAPFTEFYPSETFTETFDATGRFLSWHWHDTPSYSCDYGTENVQCTWITDDGATNCVDTYNLQADFLNTTCSTLPGTYIHCSMLAGNTIDCAYTISTLQCHDHYDSNFNRLDSTCVGQGVWASTHALCTVEPEKIHCVTDVHLTHCTLELSPIFNVLTRTCNTETVCHWGSETCDDISLDECECAWRDNARSTLCDMGSLGTDDQLDAPPKQQRKYDTHKSL